ncbi:MAG TPA: pilin [Verrucomicrobiae bacterium]|nr:pilin [Verrucomicrobiae bacterium]
MKRLFISLFVSAGMLLVFSPALADAPCICHSDVGTGVSAMQATCEACVTYCGTDGMASYGGVAQTSCPAAPAAPAANTPPASNAAPVFHTPGEYGYVNPLGTTNVTTIINRVIRTALGFVGALFLAMFIYGGAVWMTAQGDEKRVSVAKTTIRNAVIGMLIIAFSYGIISIIFQAAGQVKVGGGSTGNTTAAGGATAQSCTVSTDCSDPLAVCESGVCVNVTH